MEVNARHWMWHSLAAACGVNLSLAAYQDALGRPFLAPRQQDGVRWVVLNKDLPLALREVAKRQRDPIALAKSYRGVRRDGVHSLADPVPGLIDGGRVARRAFARVVLRRPSSRSDI
jgi:predicted ATP-grasp superfamily ATP-dependent carboligase